MFSSDLGADQGPLLYAGGFPVAGQQSPDAAGASSGAQPANVKLAVSHVFSLRMPSADVEAVQQAHLAECRKLGCTVLNTSVDRSNEGRTGGRSSVRIAPSAYAAFATAIAAPPAEVIFHAEAAEDKTLPLLDVEKRLEVKLALRDQLTAMLRDSSQKSAADLITIAKETAQVQGDIEAAIAERDHLRTITDTVKVDITYNGTGAQVSGIDLSPIDRAIRGSSQTVVGSVAALISFIVVLVPWLPLVALLAWAIRRALRLRKMRKMPA